MRQEARFRIRKKLHFGLMYEEMSKPGEIELDDGGSSLKVAINNMVLFFHLHISQAVLIIAILVLAM